MTKPCLGHLVTRLCAAIILLGITCMACSAEDAPRRTKIISVMKAIAAETGDDDPEALSFLTTEPNRVVAPVHPKAMPVILTTPDEMDRWMSAPTPEALRLQRPLADDMLDIVARGEKEDAVAT